MELTLEQYKEVYELSLQYTKVVFWTLFVFVMLILILSVIENILLRFKRQEFTNNLTEHEKALILAYKDIQAFKRRKEHK